MQLTQFIAELRKARYPASYNHSILSEDIESIQSRKPDNIHVLVKGNNVSEFLEHLYNVFRYTHSLHLDMHSIRQIARSTYHFRTPLAHFGFYEFLESSAFFYAMQFQTHQLPTIANAITEFMISVTFKYGRWIWREKNRQETGEGLMRVIKITGVEISLYHAAMHLRNLFLENQHGGHQLSASALLIAFCQNATKLVSLPPYFPINSSFPLYSMPGIINAAIDLEVLRYIDNDSQVGVFKINLTELQENFGLRRALHTLHVFCLNNGIEFEEISKESQQLACNSTLIPKVIRRFIEFYPPFCKNNDFGYSCSPLAILKLAQDIAGIPSPIIKQCSQYFSRLTLESNYMNDVSKLLRYCHHRPDSGNTDIEAIYTLSKIINAITTDHKYTVEEIILLISPTTWGNDGTPSLTRLTEIFRNTACWPTGVSGTLGELQGSTVSKEELTLHLEKLLSLIRCGEKNFLSIFELYAFYLSHDIPSSLTSIEKHFFIIYRQGLSFSDFSNKVQSLYQSDRLPFANLPDSSPSTSSPDEPPQLATYYVETQGGGFEPVINFIFFLHRLGITLHCHFALSLYKQIDSYKSLSLISFHSMLQTLSISHDWPNLPATKQLFEPTQLSNQTINSIEQELLYLSALAAHYGRPRLIAHQTHLRDSLSRLTELRNALSSKELNNNCVTLFLRAYSSAKLILDFDFNDDPTLWLVEKIIALEYKTIGGAKIQLDFSGSTTYSEEQLKKIQSLLPELTEQNKELLLKDNSVLDQTIATPTQLIQLLEFVLRVQSFFSKANSDPYIQGFYEHLQLCLCEPNSNLEIDFFDLTKMFQKYQCIFTQHSNRVQVALISAFIRETATNAHIADHQKTLLPNEQDIHVLLELDSLLKTSAHLAHYLSANLLFDHRAWDGENGFCSLMNTYLDAKHQLSPTLFALPTRARRNSKPNNAPPPVRCQASAFQAPPSADSNDLETSEAFTIKLYFLEALFLRWKKLHPGNVSKLKTIQQAAYDSLYRYSQTLFDKGEEHHSDLKTFIERFCGNSSSRVNLDVLSAEQEKFERIYSAFALYYQTVDNTGSSSVHDSEASSASSHQMG